MAPWKDPQCLKQGVTMGIIYRRNIVLTDACVQHRLGSTVRRQTSLRLLVGRRHINYLNEEVVKSLLGTSQEQTCYLGATSPQRSGCSNHRRFRKSGRSLARQRLTSSPKKATLTAQFIFRGSMMHWPTFGPTSCMLFPKSL